MDNGSTDESVKIVEEEGVLFIHHSILGAGNARNAGVLQTTGSHLIFVDADVVLPLGWLNGLNELYQKNIWLDGIVGSLAPASLKNNILRKLRLRILEIKSQGSLNLLAATTPVLNSALFSIRRSTFDRLGGFCPELKRLEDSEFTLKALYSSLNFMTYSSKATVYFDPESIFSYLKRSFGIGNWFPAIRKLDGLRFLFTVNHKEQPSIELLRLINNFFFMAGYLCGCLYRRPKRPLPHRPSKNSFYAQFKLDESNFVLNPYLSLIALPETIRVFFGEREVYIFHGYEMNLMFNILSNERIKVEVDVGVRSIFCKWIEMKLFLKV